MACMGAVMVAVMVLGEGGMCEREGYQSSHDGRNYRSLGGSMSVTDC